MRKPWVNLVYITSVLGCGEDTNVGNLLNRYFDFFDRLVAIILDMDIDIDGFAMIIHLIKNINWQMKYENDFS
jgi:hypothetical protein